MSRIARSNGSPCSIQRSASAGDSVSREAMPHFAGLQREDAPIGGVVVDDEHALARELRLRADEVARPGGSQCRDRTLDRERERRPLARAVAFRPHASAHQFGEALADREPQPGAAVLARRRRIGLRERLEQPAHAFGRQPDAGVAHGERQLGLPVRGGRRGHREHDLAALGELHRIGEQVEDDLAQPGHVADDRRQARRPRTRRRCRGASRRLGW